MKSRADLLIEELDRVVECVTCLVEASTIDYIHRRSTQYSAHGIFMAVPDAQWGPLNDQQRMLQRKALNLWRPLIEQIRDLFSGDTEECRKTIENAAHRLQQWIDHDNTDFSIPPTVREAKSALKERVRPLYLNLERIGTMSEGCIVIPDTNVLIRNQDVTKYAEIVGTDAYTVVLVPGVLEELDQHKVNNRSPSVREKARKFTQRLKGWRNQGKLAEGVRVQGDVFVRVEAIEPDFDRALSWLDKDVADDRILASILEIHRREPGAKVVLLTGDTIMQSKADIASIPTADIPDPDPE